MSTISKGWLALLVAALVLGVWLLASSHQQVPRRAIVIGSVLGLTGDAAVDSLNIQRGMELARADLAKQGINVLIKYEDDQTDSSKTVLATQRLISLYHPQAFEGFAWDFLLNSAIPIIAAAKVPVFVPASTPETSPDRSPYLFFGPPLNTTKIGPLADFLKQHEIKTAAIVIQTSAWAVEHIDIYKQAAALAGTQILSVDKTEFGEESSVFPTIVTKLKEEKAGALLWQGGAAGINVILPKLEQQGVDIPVVGEIGIEDAVRDGTVTKTTSAPWTVFTTTTDDTFVQKFKARYGDSPGLYADIAYDGVMVMVEAIRNTDGSPGAIAAYLHSGEVKYHGYSSDSFTFGADGELQGGSWKLSEVRL